MSLSKQTPSDEDENFKVYNTHRADVFFNTDNLVEHHMAIGFYQSFSGICTGVGLFGTFFAIFLGLNCLGVNPLTGQVNGIQDFINQLSGKFLSSLVGILLAVSFMFFERLGMDGIHNRCLKLQHKLDRLYPQFVPEIQINNILHTLSELGKTVGNLSDSQNQKTSLAKNIADQTLLIRELSKSIGTLSDSQNDQRNSLVENLEEQTLVIKEFLDKKFVTDLKKSFTDSFGESMKPTMDKLLEGIANLESATKMLQQEKQASAAEVIKEVVGQLTEQMNQTMKAFRESLTDEARGEIQQLAATLKSTCDLMETSNSQLSSLLNDTETKLREHQAFSQANFESLANNFQGLTDKLDATVALQNSTAEQQLSALNTTVQELISGVGKHNSEQSEQLGTAFGDLLAQTQAMLSENKAQNESARDSLNQSLESMLKKIDAAVAVQNSAAEQQMQGLQTTMQDLIEGVRQHNADQSAQTNSVVSQLLAQTQEMLSENRAQNDAARERLNQTLEVMLRKIASELTSGLENQRALLETAEAKLTEVLEQSINAIQRASEDNMKRTTQFVSQLLERVQTWLDTMTSGVSASSNQILKGVREMTNEYVEDTRQGLLYSVQAVQTANSMMIQQMSEVNNNSVESAKAIMEVQQVFKELENSIVSATASCNAQLNSMNTTGSAMHESAVDLSQSVKQLLSAQTQLQQASSLLATNMSSGTEVIEKFDMLLRQHTLACKTVESSIAAVLSSIHNSLGEYSEHTRASLGNYLSDFDKSLAQAANSLSGSVSELDVRLNELTEVMEKNLSPTRGGV